MFSNNNISKGKATAESVLENLKSLSEKTSVNLKNLSKNALGELGIGSSTSVSPKKLLDLKTPKILNSEQTSISNFSNSQSITIIRYILAFLIIGFIILNILAVTGKLPNALKDFFQPLLGFFGHAVGGTLKTTAQETEEGVKAVLDVPIDLATGGLDKLKEEIDPDKKTTLKALNHAENNEKNIQNVKADDATSRTQMYRGSLKGGYCYIGEDRGFRSCIDVKHRDECMSGDIFPSKEICINPRLRQ